jgi:N6-L-threonylcarbamoyladenine synthase
MLILGLETSCDETAAAVIEANQKIIVLSSVVSSQIALHSKWGGVVPNLAAREHLKNILPVIETSLQEARITAKKIDLIAVTNGPGLIPALLIGTNTAKTLSCVWGKPLIGIHHIEGHIYANFIDRAKSQNNKKIKFPILCLVVSGGHTQLVLMKDHLRYEIVGQTLDDAAGEAFDKVARILGLGYPGGPAIAAEAKKYRPDHARQKQKTTLPRPMLKSKNFDFSFSGLKTAVLYTVKKNPQILKDNGLISALCHEFQQAVIDVLIAKTRRAAQKYNPRTIMLAGGVSANEELRIQMSQTIKKEFPRAEYHLPLAGYSIDNAVMIAAAGFFRWQKMTSAEKKAAPNNWKKLTTDANLKLK